MSSVEGGVCTLDVSRVYRRATEKDKQLFALTHYTTDLELQTPHRKGIEPANWDYDKVKNMLQRWLDKRTTIAAHLLSAAVWQLGKVPCIVSIKSKRHMQKIFHTAKKQKQDKTP